MQPYRATGADAPAGVYLYSFALFPRARQPSGTCNFSKIERATATFGYKACAFGAGEANATPACLSLANLAVYAVGYNVLRVSQGKGALAYAS